MRTRSAIGAFIAISRGGQDQPKHRCSFRKWSEHSQSGHAGGDPASLRSRRYRFHRKRRDRAAEEVKAGLVRSRRIWSSPSGGGLLRESRCNLRRESLHILRNPPAACCRPRGRLSGSSSGLMLLKCLPSAHHRLHRRLQPLLPGS